MWCSFNDINRVTHPTVIDLRINYTLFLWYYLVKTSEQTGPNPRHYFINRLSESRKILLSVYLQMIYAFTGDS